MIINLVVWIPIECPFYLKCHKINSGYISYAKISQEYVIKLERGNIEPEISNDCIVTVKNVYISTFMDGVDAIKEEDFKETLKNQQKYKNEFDRLFKIFLKQNE